MNKILSALIVVLLCLLIFACSTLFFKDKSDKKVNEAQEVTEEIRETVEPIIEDTQVENKEETISMDDFTNPDSLLILANKTHPLDENYEPSDLVSPNVKVNKANLTLRKEAALALEEMFKAAKEEGLTLVLGSSYRSYAYQKQLFDNYVRRDGEELANRYSSRPGQSEHQTGLAVDISDAGGNHFLKQSFKDTKEGIWLAQNAHRFGFILRFPEGKEEYTGYMYEPWHFRYVGLEQAKLIYESNLSFEEYYGFID